MGVHGNHSQAALDSVLDLARILWSTAEIVGRKQADRRKAADTATSAWSGPHKDTFVSLFGHESQLSKATAQSLREEAAEWAQFWRTCANLRKDRLHDESEQRWAANNPVYAGFHQGMRQGPPRPPDLALPTPPSYRTTE